MTPAYQVLARKWRPKTFADLVGQEHIVKALQNALAEGRLHHAYLLTGTRGVGKTTIARILAKAFNCHAPQQGEPCGQCAACTAIDQGRFPDLLEIDAASNTGIDNIREVLENAQYAPTSGKYKVYIIDEVHMLSKSAFNAMLKTLEEPPPHVKFILATTDPHKVPVTVLSRCLQFVLRNMTPQQVSAHLAHVLDSEGIAYEHAALQLLARAAAGSMRDALSLLDQAIAMGAGKVNEADVRRMTGALDQQHLYRIINALIAQDGSSLLAQAQEMAANAVGFDAALAELALLLQRLALVRHVPAALADDPERDTLHSLAEELHPEQIQLYYQCAVHGRQDLPLAPDEYAGFVMTLLRMLAFAPFAADNTPVHGYIDHAAAPTAERRAILPENAPPLRRPSDAHPAPKQFKPQDLPPPKPQEIRRRDHTPLPPAAPVIAETTPAAPAPVLAETVEVEDTPPWLTDTETTSTPPAENDCPPPMPWAEDDAPPPWLDDEGNDFDVSHFTPEAEAPLIHEHTKTEASTAAENPTADTPAAEPAPAAAMPELTAENWFTIVSRIGKQVAAAQMMLQHLAWVSLENNTLTLALMDEKTIKNAPEYEYRERIIRALRQHYGSGLNLRTTAWQDDCGWETPSMYRERIVLEQRAQAKQYLEQDAAVQALLQTFSARWRESSLQLAA
ncbi:DNA polymerase III subunit gamma/tau [Conchiformibius steedae DSM 2580]|uniref:DNA polymerase III subunit gamma/tau n=1 Tax=Conchiformibius steedae DSM 2580 TaxID=1121352 RepID=A0AAE9HVL5_9NEIS|nr:DNA polymerase III subunit gamma/tau [Conchiformibius steedae]QMT32817.1 DNA polymerase III subunit gamma/tau [Conchiformibius steedae]URD67428.1 DNA polymerase III subunit gamma/tau [Conchiformibius steedae DSM 2580]